MMFMIPTPPTTKEISATTNSKLVITWLAEASASEISVRLRILKSSGAPG